MAPPRGAKDGGGKGGKGKKAQAGDDDPLEDVGGEGIRRRNQGKGKGKGGKDGADRDSPPKERSQLNSTAPDFTPTGGFGQGGYPDAISSPAYWNQWASPMLPPLWKEYRDKDGEPYYYNSKTGLCQWEKPAELEPPKQKSGVEGVIAGVLDKNREGTISSAKDADRAAARKGDGDAGKGPGGKGAANRTRRRGGKAEQDPSEFGPPGCNLFVFHLPDDWTDEDLNEYFAPHGSVVSAKVMKELGTGRSRGFGFVSYEDRVSAATAIKKMQGYKILGKRLKVEFKKGEHEGKSDQDEAEIFGEEEATGSKKGQDDERLIGYLRAISAKNVVQSLKESEDGGGG